MSYVPKCNATGKELPHTVGAYRGVVSASYTGEIPGFCPLDDFNPEPKENEK